MKRAPRTGLRQNPGFAGVRRVLSLSGSERIRRRSGMRPTLGAEHRPRAVTTPDGILTSRPDEAADVTVREQRGGADLTVR
ncbi:hypothetical protein GCM10010221_58450 [Streptomyces parvus]|nr:hypothetical protein GCM10010221_58450 [Streptomyces parvus]